MFRGVTVAENDYRKSGVGAAAGTAARIASWSGAEGVEREGERYAEEVMVSHSEKRFISIRAKIECIHTPEPFDDVTAATMIIYSKRYFIEFSNAEDLSAKLAQTRGMLLDINT